MAETKDEIAADRGRLKDENEKLRAQLDQARATGAAVTSPANPDPGFQLSAGEHADLLAHGFTRSVRDSSVITAHDFPDHIDVDELSDTARAGADREKAKREQGAQGAAAGVTRADITGQ